MSDPTKLEISLDRLGPAGIPGELVIVPVFKDRTLSDHERLTDSRIRRFTLKALLGKHSSKETNIKASISEDDGDSFLLAAKEAVHGKLYSPKGVMLLRHNLRKEISLIEFSCDAVSAFDAKAIFQEALTPFLDQMSFLANIPMHLLQMSCFDETHQLQSIGYVAPHASHQLNPHEGAAWEELFPIYALYREAKNNPSPFYKFLCYYKILEGIYMHLRPEMFKKAKLKGLTIKRRKENVPEFQEPIGEEVLAQGKPIKEIFDSRFQPEFRNQTAHFLLNDGNPLNVSSYKVAAKYSNELRLIESCARVVIETHAEYLSDINKAV